MGHTGLTPQQFRERAVGHARRQMQRSGPNGVRLTVIARAMGVSHAALYSYFDDRDALIDAVVAQWLAEDRVALAAICDAPGEPRDRLHRWYAERYRRKRDRARTDALIYAGFDLAAERNQPSVRSHLAEMDRQLAALLAPLGITHPGARQQLTAAMSAFLHPALVVQNADQDRECLMVSVLDTMVNGLGPTPDTD